MRVVTEKNTMNETKFPFTDHISISVDPVTPQQSSFWYERWISITMTFHSPTWWRGLSAPLKQRVPQVLRTQRLDQRVDHKVHGREEERNQVLEREQGLLRHGEEVQREVEEGGLRARHDERDKVAGGADDVSLGVN